MQHAIRESFEPGRNTQGICVGELDWWTTDLDLEKVFAPHGRYGSADFESCAMLVNAQHWMSGMEYHPNKSSTQKIIIFLGIGCMSFGFIPIAKVARAVVSHILNSMIPEAVLEFEPICIA